MAITAADVLEIMDSKLTELQIAPFLVTSQAIVTANLSSSALSATILDEIRKYLAAHLASIRSPFAIRKKLGESEETYGYKGGLGLNATPYGEVVKMLDTSGILFSIMSEQIVTVGILDFALDDD